MYILDETKYCWTTDDTCGEPQATIKDAIENFYEDDCQNLDCPTVCIGHPSYYIPDMFNAEQMIGSRFLLHVFNRRKTYELLKRYRREFHKS